MHCLFSVFGVVFLFAYGYVEKRNIEIFGCDNLDVQNIIVTSGATLTLEAVGDINVQNVTVKNGAKLIFDAAGKVNIISDFEVESGSEFEIIYP